MASIQAGEWHTLRVVKRLEFGLYLDGGEAGEILLPKRFAPADAQPGDELQVFLYHDSEDRLIATTQTPKGIVGDIVLLRCVGATRQGAFLDWGLMKDLFVPLSQQLSHMKPGGQYLVRLYRDERTGRMAASEKFESQLQEIAEGLEPLQPVALTIWRQTELGYLAIINHHFVGLLYFSDLYRDYDPGDTLQGFIKAIRPDGKIDLAPGEAGYARVEDAGQKILRLLDAHNGYLPYHDKSDSEDIRDFFGMSKKTFKMALGGLYKQGKIEFTQQGIRRKED
ncbi:MAG: RNA-binding protein [Bacteroidetes bacterium]|nr:RNA-binding protein [Bacteroidota bacterium]MBS1630305.1 RNA-binding protein [Bacteroidota bacterium]